jgi:Flp pilus assembly protein TadB
MFAPAYISCLWTDETGKTLAMGCALWLMLGIAVLRRMARIEV